MSNYFLGIDIGGTNIKAAVFSAEGILQSVVSQPTPVEVVRQDFHEREMLTLWKKTAEAIRETIARAGISACEILAVGCAGHGKGLYLWGKDHCPCYPAIASTDRRAAGLIKQWETDGTAAKAQERTLQTTLACQPVALLAWLKREQPEVYGKIRWIFEAKDFIRFMLTGEAYAEYTDSSGTGLLNLHTKQYDSELLELYGIPEIENCLPPLAESAALCGRVTRLAAAKTGLPEGTPVCGGMFDIDACAIAMGVSDPDPVCMITGTWSINEYLAEKPTAPEKHMNHSLFCIPKYYLVEESSPTSAGNLEWVLSQMCGMENPDYAEIDKLVLSVNPADSSAVFIPFLYGSNSDKLQNAAWFGLHSGQTTAHLLRAVYEGVAFSHKQHTERLLACRKAPPYIRIGGGAANSDVWMQLFADVMGIPVQVVEGKELGALGSAIAAAVCCGVYPDYKTAAEKMVRIRREFQPQKDAVPVYQKKYDLYQEYLNRS